MGKLRKAMCVIAAAAIACTAAGCSDMSSAMTANDKDIRAGVYIDYLYSEMSYQIQMMYYTNGVTENFFDQTVEDKPFSQYLKDQAMTSTKEYAAITAKFEELGLTLSDDEIKEINETVNSEWDSSSDLYEKIGIGKESLKEVYRCSAMRSAIFEYFYGEGGTDEVTAEEMQKYVEENYLRYKVITFSKSTAADDAQKESENKEALALRDEYLEKAEGMSFEDFDELIAEYDDYKAAQQEEESEDTSDDTSSDESTDSTESTDSADSTESVESTESESTDSAESIDSTESTDSTDSADSTDESAQSDTDTSLTDDTSSAADSTESDVSSEEESAAEDESSAESESDESAAEDETAEDTEEEDPYVNESMVNYGDMDEESLEGDYGKLLTEVSKKENGIAFGLENDNAYYIFIKGDVSEREDYVDDNKDSVLNYMKGDEFQESIDQWVAAINFVNNEKALRRYTPEVIYERQNDYYESVQ